jgi:hypothetical protein
MLLRATATSSALPPPLPLCRCHCHAAAAATALPQLLPLPTHPAACLPPPVHLLAAMIELRVGGRGGLIMVTLSMDAFIDTQVDVLLAGHFSVQIPTQVGDVNSQNQNKSRYIP